MADFVSKSVVKSSVRELSSPLASKAELNTIIGTILANNQWGCTLYTSGGEDLPAVSIGLLVISCMSTALLWVWQIRKIRVQEIFSYEQDNDGEFWVVGLAGGFR